MNREQKVAEVKSLAERMKRARALIFAGYRGLKVSEMTELRSKLKEGRSTLKVVKNRLMKRALEEGGLGALAKYFVNPTALTSSDSDPAIPAKVLVEFAKGHERLEIKGGWLDGQQLSAADIDALSKLPSREVLIARALGSMQGPARGIAAVMAAVPRKLLYALNAIKGTKQ